MKVKLFAVVLVLFLGAQLLGQELTGTVRGLVTDQTGLSVEKASVGVSGGSANMKADTDSGGGFAFTLPPGEYSLTFAKEGFNSVQKSVLVHTGGNVVLNITLEVSGGQQSVTVEEKAPEIDTGSHVISTTVSSEEQTKIPSGTGYVGLLTKAPGVRAEPVGGGFMAHGSSAAENDFHLNGVKTSDTETGSLRTNLNFPHEFVEETQIKMMGDAQYGSSLGAVVNGVLKRGTNSIHGQVWTYSTWDGINGSPRPTPQLSPFDDEVFEYFENKKDKFSVFVPGYIVGFPLPILKKGNENRVFFLSGSRPSFGRSERDVKFLRNNLPGTFSSSTRQDFNLNKIDADLEYRGKPLHMSVAHLYSPLKVSGILPGRDGTGSPDTKWEQRGFRLPSTLILWNAAYFPGNKLTVSLYGGWNYENYKDTYGLGRGPSIAYLNSNIGMAGVPRQFQSPSGDFTPNNLQTPKKEFRRTNFYGNASYLAQFKGSHLFDFGYQLDSVSTDIFANTWPDGRFLVAWGLRYPGVKGIVSGRYGFYVTDAFETSGKVKSRSNAVYIQDKWQVRKNLVLNLGLRTENESVPSFIGDRNAISFGWKDKFSPRVGVAYDPTGSGASKVSAGFAVAYDVMKYNLPISAFGGDKWIRCFHPLNDADVFSLKNNGAAAAECVNYRVPANNSIDRNLKPMQQRMMSAGYERVSGNWIFGIYGVRKYLVWTVEDNGRLVVNNGVIEEQFSIVNPGRGRSVDPSWFPKDYPSPITPKAKRNYKALELTLAKRGSGYTLFASHTISNLYGNYSGLASSDERGRLSPNTDRDFDLAGMDKRDKDGKLVYGNLATDRPHVFKFLGSKEFSNRLGKSDLGVSFIAQSGTPLSTQVAVLTGIPMFVYGRGNLGRTPMFSQTDMTFGHEFKLKDFKESQRIRMELTVGNLFNQKTALDAATSLLHPHDGNLYFSSSSAVFKGYDPQALMQKQDIRENPAYKKWSAFQPSRSARVAVRFFF